VLPTIMGQCNKRKQDVGSREASSVRSADQSRVRTPEALSPVLRLKGAPRADFAPRRIGYRGACPQPDGADHRLSRHYHDNLVRFGRISDGNRHSIEVIE
jgi:hypothetical protein